MARIIIDTYLYTPPEAAKLLNVGQATVYRLLKAGKLIPDTIAGRMLIPQSEIDRVLKIYLKENGAMMAYKETVKDKIRQVKTQLGDDFGDEETMEASIFRAGQEDVMRLTHPYFQLIAKDNYERGMREIVGELGLHCYLWHDEDNKQHICIGDTWQEFLKEKGL